MDFSLIAFGEDWGAHPSSTQHLVSRLAQRHQTLWVNSIGLRRPRLERRDLVRALSKCKAMLGDRHVDAAAAVAPFPVIAPRAVSFPGSATAGRINRYLLGGQIRRAMENYGISRPVLWTSLPSAVDLVGAFDECALVYYCGDDFGALEGVDHEPVLDMEQRLSEHADLILTSHPNLLERFPAHKTHLVPHGVDTELFTNARAWRVNTTDRPTVGFCGCIDSRLHLQALRQAANQLPDWQFEFVGPTRVDTSVLAGLSNVYFHGPVPGSQVPSLLRGWNVALLPYRDNDMVRACNPLKLREYMASGTPVAAIDMAALDGYRGLVAWGSPDELAANIRRAASMNNQELRRLRQRTVATEDWQLRVRDVEELITAVLVQKARPLAA
jgi:glycosyltransferase involved in cell wall biosynthesis